MTFTYPTAASLNGKEKVGSHEWGALDAKKRHIKRRFITAHGGPFSDGSWPLESDNTDEIFVIEKSGLATAARGRPE